MNSVKLIFSVMLMLGMSASALADCRVLYGYQEGSGTNRVNRDRNVVLTPGQTGYINRSRMNFVKLRASSQNSVWVVLANRSFQLDKGNVDPPVGPYLAETTLLRLECLTSISLAAQRTKAMANQMQ